MNRTAAIEYIENFVGNVDQYEIESIAEYLYDEHQTWDFDTIEYAAKREAARMYAVNPHSWAL